MSTLAGRIERELGLALDASDRARLVQLDERPLSAAGHDADLWAAARSVLVHETWFFRDAAVFDELASIAAGAHGPLRVLSAPCATGEEAWSIAMTLAEAGLGAGAFEVLGVDVADAALAAASTATYGPRSIRTELRPSATDWMVREGNVTHVRHPLARQVRFAAANLVAPGALRGEGPFDVIFCRNFLVYLTPTARAAVDALLDRLLGADGTLFLGAGESPSATIFERVGAADRFCFRRRAASARTTAEEARGPGPSRPAASRTPRASTRPRPRPSASEPAPPGLAVVAVDEPSVETARALADRGELEASRALVERVLMRDGHDAEAYALLGTIQSALGRGDEAAAAWRRALYLDPFNEVARVSLATQPRMDREGARRASPASPRRSGRTG